VIRLARRGTAVGTWAGEPGVSRGLCNHTFGPSWVRTASGTAGPRRARAVTPGIQDPQIRGIQAFNLGQRSSLGPGSSPPSGCREPCGLLPTRRVVTEDGPHRTVRVSHQRTRIPGSSLAACHYRATHSGPYRSPADNHGQRRSSIDLCSFTSPQVTIEADLALGAGGRRFKSGRPDHQHEPPAQQGCRRPLTRLTGARCP
jgi:hypothetical protein